MEIQPARTGVGYPGGINEHMETKMSPLWICRLRHAAWGYNLAHMREWHVWVSWPKAVFRYILGIVMQDSRRARYPDKAGGVRAPGYLGGKYEI